MKTIDRFLMTVLIAVGSALSAAAAETPTPVSPGYPARLAVVEGRCPTFSWGALSGAQFYELFVYELDGQEPTEGSAPAIRARVPGSALSWTPSLERCLERGGRYGWLVRAVQNGEASEWSAPIFFRVALPTRAEFEEAMEVVRSFSAPQRNLPWPEPEELGSAPSSDTRLVSNEKQDPPVLATDSIAVVVDGGISAASFTGDGAGLTNLDAANLASGTVAPARGGFGFDASSAPAGSVLFTSATGTWGVLPKGSDGQVLKLAGGAPAWGSDASNEGTVTQLVGGTGVALTPSTITTIGAIGIDTSVVPQLDAANSFALNQSMPSASFTATTGAPFTVASGAKVSNLNADLLDGLEASGFATASHPHSESQISDLKDYLEKTTSSSQTLDMNAASDTTLSIINSGLGLANLVVDGGIDATSLSVDSLVSPLNLGANHIIGNNLFYDGFTGELTATSFTGDGSELTNVASEVRFEYDVSGGDGGSTGVLWGLGAFVPDNAVIIDGMIEITDEFFSDIGLATIRLSIESSGDLKEGQVLSGSWEPGFYNLKPTGIATTVVKTSAPRQVTVEVLDEPLTAGRLVGYIRYFVGG